MRQSNILIICFVIFVLAFVGYSFWQPKSKSPSHHLNVSKEQQESDMKMAEKYLQGGMAERALFIVHQYKNEMETHSPEGKKWLNLFVDASATLNDSDQLMLIYQFNPIIFHENEKGALNLANAFLKGENQNEYHHIRNIWKGKEINHEAWDLVDADAFLQQGQKQQAYEILKNKKWSEPLEDERLMRLALIRWHDNPQEALEFLNAQYLRDPKNPEIYLFRGKIYESANKIALAEQAFQAAADLEPKNIYLQDQLAEFYLRQKDFNKALSMWEKLLPLTSNDHIWVKGLFWNHIAIPTEFDWKNAQLSEEKARPFLVYLLSLKSDQYWDPISFEALPNTLDILSEYQATYWLRLLQALKDNQEQEALTLLNNNPFATSSWAPQLEITLRRILNYRKYGSFMLEEDIPHTGSLLQMPAGQKTIPHLYKEIEEFAQQEMNQGRSFKLPESMQALVNNPEIFSSALLAEGWTEAALQLYPIRILSSEFPDWVPSLYVAGIRQNRGNREALKFIDQQKQTPQIILLKAEIEIADGKADLAAQQLKKLQSDPSEIGARATWLLSLIELQKGHYRKAGEAIEKHPKLAKTLQAQETLGRIALMEGETETAAKIYQRIVSQSSEAKSFLARQAYQQKNWILARELTEDLLNDFPGNEQLKGNLKKIIAQEEAIK